MRSFTTIFAVAALIASPLVSARSITVDSKDLEKLEKDFNKIKNDLNKIVSGSGASSSGSDTSSVPTFDRNTPSVVVPTLEDPIANAGGPFDTLPVDNQGVPSVAVDTLEDSGSFPTTTGSGTCTNADPQCNKFQDFNNCWQVCLASQRTKNPVGRGPDNKAPNCADWCSKSCGCEKGPTNAMLGSAQPSDSAWLTEAMKTRTSQSRTI